MLQVYFDSIATTSDTLLPIDKLSFTKSQAELSAGERKLCHIWALIIERHKWHPHPRVIDSCYFSPLAISALCIFILRVS